MVGSRKLKQALDRTLSAQLVPIDHESLNSTFVGYSQKHKQQIFVKVFLQRQKLVTEKAVNVQLNQRVLESFTLATTPELFV
ncbi:hypothetical protein EQ500_09695, partial [Lactobacillus sp. XV13L]|nr:hypothetical protein [Lactobacillus sp. XV13L]